LPWQDKSDKFTAMEGQRIEAAVQRIEQALARIVAIADRETVLGGPSPAAPASASPNVLQLVSRHESLRESVLAELELLDTIIGKLEG
jgi:hypothetical protein